MAKRSPAAGVVAVLQASRRCRCRREVGIGAFDFSYADEFNPTIDEIASNKIDQAAYANQLHLFCACYQSLEPIFEEAAWLRRALSAELE